jgi:hypothetical protein
MVERMTYKRQELCEENTCYEVNDFTARAGAPKKHLFYFAPSPNSTQAGQDDAQPLLPDQICSPYLAYESVRLQSFIEPAVSEDSFLGYIS